jgi:hypothetical protein
VTTKKQMTTLPKTKELPNVLSPFISFQSTSWPQIQDELFYWSGTHTISDFSLSSDISYGENIRVPFHCRS